MKRALLAVTGFAIAVFAAAELVKDKDWAKSPEADFLTLEERAEWSKIGNDPDAEKFIAVYWAKRGGERFKVEIQRRIAAADEQFKLRRQRGAESARGRLLITLGSPSRVSQSRLGPAGEAPETAPPASTLPSNNPFGTGAGETIIQTWIYEKDKFDPSWGIGEIRARIAIDPQRGTDELQMASAVDRAMAKVAVKSIVSPTATAATAQSPVASHAPEPAGTGPASAPAAPPGPVTAGLPAATRASLEGVLKEKKEEAGPVPVFWGGLFRTPSGEPFYAFQFYLEEGKMPAGPLKFGGLVTGESGGEVATFWEDAAFSDMKTGSKADKAYERSLVLPSGSYIAALGLFASEGGAPLESAVVRFVLAPKPPDLEVTPLLLTNELKPLTKRPGSTDPFVFGVEKPIKVEPKADRTFSKQDSLWYFYAVTNATIPEAAAAAATPSATPAPGAAKPAAPSAESPKPRIMQRIGVLKDGKPAFAPATGTPEMQPLAPGTYASGSEIPLATFEPGYYTFMLNVRDLNAPRESSAFKGIDRQADFIVLKPDGALPEKAVPRPAVVPTPTPKPRPKKG